MLTAHYGIVKGNVKTIWGEKQCLWALRLHFTIERLKTKSLCGKALLHLEFSKMLIAYSSANVSYLIISFRPCLENSDGGVLVKVERLHPLETSAVNNVISCFGNENWAGNSSPVLCSSTFSRCRVPLTLNFNYILMECPIYVPLKSTFLLYLLVYLLLFLNVSIKIAVTLATISKYSFQE